MILRATGSWGFVETLVVGWISVEFGAFNAYCSRRAEPKIADQHTVGRTAESCACPTSVLQDLRVAPAPAIVSRRFKAIELVSIRRNEGPADVQIGEIQLQPKSCLRSS